MSQYEPDARLSSMDGGCVVLVGFGIITKNHHELYSEYVSLRFNEQMPTHSISSAKGYLNIKIEYELSSNCEISSDAVRLALRKLKNLLKND